MRLRSGRRLVSPVAAPRGAAARRVRRPRQRSTTDGGGVREEEDRLSSLPLDLQLEVLARLRCAREAARTSMVSRPWRGLWTQLRELTFDGIADPDKLAGALRRFGELTQAGPRLNRLCIHLPGNLKLGDARISSLLHAADRLAPLELELVEHVEDCAADERAAPEEAGVKKKHQKKLGCGVPSDLGSPTQNTSVTNGFIRCEWPIGLVNSSITAASWVSQEKSGQHISKRASSIVSLKFIV